MVSWLGPMLKVGHLIVGSATVDHEAYRDGYVAGWKSVRGPDSDPSVIPACPAPVETAMYAIGFSGGVRDAMASRTLGRRLITDA
jgi:hypothetical protein